MTSINKHVLITGCAGFIGAALSKRFLRDKYKVTGIDNINDYYDQNLKISRLEDIKISVILKVVNGILQISIDDKNKLKIFLENPIL